MFKDEDLIEVYSELDAVVYMAGAKEGDIAYQLDPKEKGVPSYVSIPFKVVRNNSRKSQCIKNGMIRFNPEVEDEIYRALGINPERSKNFLNKNEITRMVIDTKDSDYKKVLEMDDINIIESILAEIVSLKNTLNYDISEKFEAYVKARLEELQEGKVKTELVYEPSKNEELLMSLNEEEEEEDCLEEEEEVEVKEEKQPESAKKTTTKPKNAPKTRNSRTRK